MNQLLQQLLWRTVYRLLQVHRNTNPMRRWR